MLVILLNCVTLGMFHPCEDIACDSPRCRILQVLRGGEDWAGSSPAGAVSHDGRSCAASTWEMLVLVLGCAVLSGKAPAGLCQPQPSQAFLGVLGEGQPSSGQRKQCPKYPCPSILALCWTIWAGEDTGLLQAQLLPTFERCKTLLDSGF